MRAQSSVVCGTNGKPNAPRSTINAAQTDRAASSAPGRRFGHGRTLLERLPPRAVLLVPAHGLRETLLERDLVAPAELLAELRRVEQVAPVVAGAVRHDRLQARRLSRELEHRVCDLLDRLLDAGADVVRVTFAPSFEDELDRAAVVAHVQPLALVLRRRVERQLAIVERVRDEQRNDLLRELKRPVVVGAV